MILHDLAVHTSSLLHDLLQPVPDIPNGLEEGDPIAPPGVDEKVYLIFDYVRWFTLVAAGVTGTLAALAITGGRWLGNLGWSKAGGALLASSVVSIIVYVTVIPALETIGATKGK